MYFIYVYEVGGTFYSYSIVSLCRNDPKHIIGVFVLLYLVTNQSINTVVKLMCTDVTRVYITVSERCAKYCILYNDTKNSIN